MNTHIEHQKSQIEHEISVLSSIEKFLKPHRTSTLTVSSCVVHAERNKINRVDAVMSFSCSDVDKLLDTIGKFCGVQIYRTPTSKEFGKNVQTHPIIPTDEDFNPHRHQSGQYLVTKTHGITSLNLVSNVDDYLVMFVFNFDDANSYKRFNQPQDSKIYETTYSLREALVIPNFVGELVDPWLRNELTKKVEYTHAIKSAHEWLKNYPTPFMADDIIPFFHETFDSCDMEIRIPVTAKFPIGVVLDGLTKVDRLGLTLIEQPTTETLHHGYIEPDFFTKENSLFLNTNPFGCDLLLCVEVDERIFRVVFGLYNNHNYNILHENLRSGFYTPETLITYITTR